ncbi:hypothetical protein EON63_18890 [archaeon]|nr:MAG: hypothetical protein EON63_18890 [archaeon]
MVLRNTNNLSNGPLHHTPTKNTSSNHSHADNTSFNLLKFILSMFQRGSTGNLRLWQLFLCLSVMGCFFYYLLVSSTIYIDEERLSYHIKSESSKAQLTVVMNTFKRHDMMMGRFPQSHTTYHTQPILIIIPNKHTYAYTHTHAYVWNLSPYITFHHHTH